MKSLHLAGILLATFVIASAASAREWSDNSGKFKVEAELVAVKDGKAYLEKSDGSVAKVEVSRLSKADQEYVLSLPEYRDYFQKNPIVTPTPGPASGATPGSNPGKRMAVISVPDENKIGEIRRSPDLGWGVTSLAFSPDGGLLAVGKMDQALALYDVDKFTRSSLLEKLDNLGQVTSVAFTPDGKKLLSGGYSGRIQVWNVGPGGTLSEANRFVGHSGEVNTITVSGDGKTVISGGGEKKLRGWDLETARELFAVDGFQGAVKSSYLSRSGKQALACDGETLALIDTQGGKVVQAMKLATHIAQAVAISPDGLRVVVSDTYALRIWETRTGKELPSLQDKEIQWTARFTPNGKYILSGGRGKVNLWEVATQRKTYEFDMAQTILYVQTLACSPDNRHFAAIPSSAGQALQVFRLPADVAKE